MILALKRSRHLFLIHLFPVTPFPTPLWFLIIALKRLICPELQQPEIRDLYRVFRKYYILGTEDGKHLYRKTITQKLAPKPPKMPLRERLKQEKPGQDKEK